MGARSRALPPGSVAEASPLPSSPAGSPRMEEPVLAAASSWQGPGGSCGVSHDPTRGPPTLTDLVAVTYRRSSLFFNPQGAPRCPAHPSQPRRPQGQSAGSPAPSRHPALKLEQQPFLWTLDEGQRPQEPGSAQVRVQSLPVAGDKAGSLRWPGGHMESGAPSCGLRVHIMCLGITSQRVYDCLSDARAAPRVAQASPLPIVPQERDSINPALSKGGRGSGVRSGTEVLPLDRTSPPPGPSFSPRNKPDKDLHLCPFFKKGTEHH